MVPAKASISKRGDILRAGGSLVFVRGIMTAEGRPCLSFSGTIKKARKDKMVLSR